jgi:phosphoglycerol geranylgeranyltransferase
MTNSIYSAIHEQSGKGRKQFSLLIDPDKYSEKQLAHCISLANKAGVDYVFIGGSLLTENKMRSCIRFVKEHSELPVLLFPGSTLQFCEEADAMLFLSLISGRNADLLIGRHVEIAPFLKNTSVEIIPTGYMLVDGGRPTTASYISNTFPIPYDKPDIAACTAMAGELLGLKLIYMDCGSGAQKPLSYDMMHIVKSNINIPLIVGGGIRSAEQIDSACRAGADVIVVGNIIEQNPELLLEFGEAIQAIA